MKELKNERLRDYGVKCTNIAQPFIINSLIHFLVFHSQTPKGV